MKTIYKESVENDLEKTDIKKKILQSVVNYYDEDYFSDFIEDDDKLRGIIEGFLITQLKSKLSS